VRVAGLYLLGPLVVERTAELSAEGDDEHENAPDAIAA
jgi:hypothetical protein